MVGQPPSSLECFFCSAMDSCFSLKRPPGTDSKKRGPLFWKQKKCHFGTLNTRSILDGYFNPLVFW